MQLFQQEINMRLFNQVLYRIQYFQNTKPSNICNNHHWNIEPVLKKRELVETCIFIEKIGPWPSNLKLMISSKLVTFELCKTKGYVQTFSTHWIIKQKQALTPSKPSCLMKPANSWLLYFPAVKQQLNSWNVGCLRCTEPARVCIMHYINF